MPVNRRQVLEWVDDPVTEVLLKLCKQEQQDMFDVPISNVLAPGEPVKSQERLVKCAKAEEDMELFIGLLEGNFKQLDYLDNYDTLVEGYDEDSEGSDEGS